MVMKSNMDNVLCMFLYTLMRGNYFSISSLYNPIKKEEKNVETWIITAKFFLLTLAEIAP